MKNIQKMLKAVLITGLLCAVAGVGYAESEECFGAKLIKRYEPEYTCTEKIIVDYHRKHGISEQNKQRLYDAYGFDSNEPENVQLEILQNRYFKGLMPLYTLVDGVRQYTPSENSVYWKAEDLAKCEKVDAISEAVYQAAFDRHLELVKIINEIEKACPKRLVEDYDGRSEL